MKTLFKYLFIPAACIFSAQSMAVPSQYLLIEDAADGAKVTTSFNHGAGQTNPGSPPDPYGYYTTEFPKMNDYNEVAARVPAALAVDPRVSASAGEATIWKGANTDDGTGVRSRTSLGLVYCRETVSLCGSRALDINNIGTVGGSSHDYGFFGAYPEKSYIWRDGWYRAPLGAFSGQSFIADVSDLNDLAGSGIHNLDYLAHGGVRTGGRDYTIGALYTQSSYAHAINDSGEATGQADFGGGKHAYHWSVSLTIPTLVDIGTLGGSFSVGYDINNSSDIVGYSADSSGNARGFIWDSNTNTMQSLGVLGSTATENASIARSINDQGLVVGYSTTSAGDQHAFIFENGTMYDLNTLIPSSSGWTLVDAYHINEYGEILVRGIRGSENKYLILTFSGITKCRSCDYPNTDLFNLESAQKVSSDGYVQYLMTEVDTFGNVYLLLRINYTGAIDLDPTDGVDIQQNLNAATYLQKLNADGSYAWSILRGPATDMEVDVEGNIYVAAEVAKVGFSGETVSLVKYDANGNILLNLEQLQYAAGIKLGSIDSDKNGNLYIAVRYIPYGTGAYPYVVDFDFTSGVDNLTGNGDYVIKMSKNGDYLGTTQLKYLSGLNAAYHRISVNALNDGGFVLIGLMRSNSNPASMDMDASSTSSSILSINTGSGFYLVKYDENDNYVWSKIILTANGMQQFNSVRTDLVGNIYTLASFTDTANILQKFDSNGNALWAPKTMAGTMQFNTAIYSGNFGTGAVDRMLEVDSAGNIFAIGTGDTNVGLDYDTSAQGSDVQYGSAFITKINTDGSYAGTSSYGDTWSGKPYSVALDSIGNAILVGRYDAAYGLDDILTSPGVSPSYEAFILRLNP